jgi:hypothetical protein
MHQCTGSWVRTIGASWSKACDYLAGAAFIAPHVRMALSHHPNRLRVHRLPRTHVATTSLTSSWCLRGFMLSSAGVCGKAMPFHTYVAEAVTIARLGQ